MDVCTEQSLSIIYRSERVGTIKTPLFIVVFWNVIAVIVFAAKDKNNVTDAYKNPGFKKLEFGKFQFNWLYISRYD